MEPGSVGSPRGVVVAVDGSSGSGKSSVSREVAKRHGFGYLDTGAMYRAVTWACVRDNALADPIRMAEVARVCSIDISVDPYQASVAVDGIDVTEAIRTSDIAQVVSGVARVPEVREVLIASQRTLIQQACERFGGVVAEGRDITTVVAPHAQVRILMHADPQARVNRRSVQFSQAGVADASAAAVRELDRDRADAQVNDFERPASGVIVVDNSNVSFAEVVDHVASLVPVSPAFPPT